MNTHLELKTETLLEINPFPKPRMTRGSTWSPAAKRYWAFKDEVKLLARSKRLVLSGSGDTIVFLLPMPFGWAKSKKNSSLLAPHRSRPDLDNLLKALWDALEIEDKHIYGVTAIKLWSNTGAIIVYQ
jgi:Holliday junction resolvase RusA-like endonuclease